MAAIDDLTELVEQAAAAERTTLAAKWKDWSDVQASVGRARRAAEEHRAAVRRDQHSDRLSPRWAELRQNYLGLGAQEPAIGDAIVTHAQAAQAEADAVAAVGVARIAMIDAALAVLQARLARIDAGEDVAAPQRSTATSRWPAAIRSAGTGRPWPTGCPARSATS